MALFSLRGLLHFAFDGGSFGDARIGALFQWVGYLRKVLKGVKDIRFARDIRPGERLAGMQPPCAIGQRIVRMEALGAVKSVR